MKNAPMRNAKDLASTKHVCQICGKGPVSANNKPHSQTRTKRVVKPNTQSLRVQGLKLTVCTRCIRTLSKKVSLQENHTDSTPTA